MTLSDLTRSLHIEQLIEHRRVTRILAERERRQGEPPVAIYINGELLGSVAAQERMFG